MNPYVGQRQSLYGPLLRIVANFFATWEETERLRVYRRRSWQELVRSILSNLSLLVLDVRDLILKLREPTYG